MTQKKLDRESEIIGAFLTNKELDPAALGLDKGLFKSQNGRLVCGAIVKGTRDEIEIFETLKVKSNDIASYIESCKNGLYSRGVQTDRVKELIKSQKIDLLNNEVIELISDGSRKGFYEHEKIKVKYDEIYKLSLPQDGDGFKSISSINPACIEWLIYNKIPQGSYTSLCGDPGEGKSILLTYICAKVTKGETLPDQKGYDPQGSIIYFVAEDNLADTVRIRAEDAGADLEKFIVSTGEKKDGSFFSIVNPEDRKSLEQKIQELGDVKIIAFDPITTFMAGLRTNDENEVRAALAPLNRLAEKYKLAIIGISHLNKDQAKRALYRLSGSIAFVAVARTVWLVKKDEDSERRYFSPLKYNILKNPSTLAFEVKGALGHPVIEFETMPIDITAEELLADEDQQERFSALQEAVIFLDELVQPGTEKAHKEIEKEAKAAGHAMRTLKRAKKRLKIQSEQKLRQWYWVRK